MNLAVGAGCLRSWKSAAFEQLPDSIRHETLMADLQETVPCAARSPYSMLRGAVADLGPVLGTVRRRGGGRLRCGLACGKSNFLHGAAAARSVELQREKTAGRGSAGGGTEQCRLWPFTML